MKTLLHPYREAPLWPFLFLSVALFAALGIVLAIAIQPEAPPKFVEVDLSDLQGVKNEPPPLGEPDASPVPAVATTPAPTLEATPEPTPEMTPTPPPPEATPGFIKPEPSAAPSATPRSVQRPRAPKVWHTPFARTAPGVAQNIRGSPSGKAGAHGSSKGDFISTPHPEYDATALQRHYQGAGTVLIIYSGGSIISVEMSESTGVSYLDSRTVAWVKNYWKVRPGASGRAFLPISWRIQ